jgi:hypothetical protein
VVLTSCSDSAEQIAARAQLDELGVSYSDDEFLERVRQHDPVAVELLLAAGMDPNLESGKALRIAAESDYVDIINILLDRGADVNAKDLARQKSALCVASLYGEKAETLQILFERGAKIKGCGCEDYILTEPASRLDIESVRLLLDHGLLRGESSRTGNSGFAPLWL